MSASLPLSGEAVALATRLSADLSRLVADPPAAEWAAPLKALTRVYGQLPGVVRAAAVAFDAEGALLASEGCSAEGLASGSTAALWSAVQSGMCGWTSIVPVFAGGERLSSVGLPLPGDAPPRCLLVFGFAGEMPAHEPVLQAVWFHAACAAAFIRMAASAQALWRTRQLRDIALRGIVDPPRDLRRIVDDLARLFGAAEATLLLEEFQELRFAASTRFVQGQEPVLVCRPGEGLAGTVFESAAAIRQAEVAGPSEVLGGTASAADSAGGQDDARCLRFLGVPLRNAERSAALKSARSDVVGVLYLTRHHVQSAFTPADEAELQFTADLLGAVLARAWDFMLLRSILDSPSEAVAVSRWERTPSGSSRRIVKLNRGCRQLLRREEWELIGRDAESIYAKEAYADVKAGLTHALQHGLREHGPVMSRLRRKDGTVIHAEVSYRLVSNRMLSPPTHYTIGFARDVSARERQAALLADLGIAYFRADRQGRTIESSPAESRITGYSATELRSLSREELYVDKHERRLLIQKARLSGGAVQAHLQQFRRKNGRKIWVEGDMRLVAGPAGGDAGVEGFYRDVTDRIRVQGFVDADATRALTDAELFDRLKQNSRFQMDYLTSLGHQLQTPLRALVESLKNLQVGVIDSRRMEERLPYLIGQALVCSRLVRNLSYMDKILRREPVRRRNVRLARLAIETQIDFLHLLKGHSLTLGVEEEGLDAHCQVSGHNEMLRQVVVNLVDNAIKYSLPGTRIVVRGHPGAVFEISNRGLRIPEEQRQRIFERGFRARKAIALVPAGTGFGLWLVRKILDAHGAVIRCFEQTERDGIRTVFQIQFAQSTAGEGGKR